MTDNFSDTKRGVLDWTNGDPDEFAMGYRDGEFFINVFRYTFWDIQGPYYDKNLKDVGMAIDVRFVRDQSQIMELACRISRDGDYQLLVDPHRGTFRLGISWADVPPLVDWRSSKAIRTGTATNRIELYCIGDSISAWANGELLASAKDSYATDPSMRFTAAMFGAGARDERVAVDARFDNLIIYTSPFSFE